MPTLREKALSLNVVIVANAAVGPRDLVDTADIVVEAETRSMLKNRFGPCDHDLARALLQNLAPSA